MWTGKPRAPPTISAGVTMGTKIANRCVMALIKALKKAVCLLNDRPNPLPQFVVHVP